MANDDPTSLRMAFGYPQARNSGIAGFIAPPNAAQMNADLNWARWEKKVRALVDRDNSVGPLVRELIAKQRKIGEYSVEILYHSVLCYRPDLAPPAYQPPAWALLKIGTKYRLD